MGQCALCERVGVPVCHLPLNFDLRVPLCSECFERHVGLILVPVAVRLYLLLLRR